MLCPDITHPTPQPSDISASAESVGSRPLDDMDDPIPSREAEYIVRKRRASGETRGIGEMDDLAGVGTVT